MDPVTIGVVVFAFFFVLVGFGMPIGFAFLAAGLVGTTQLVGPSAAISALARVPFTWINNYVFTTVPLFIYTGLLSAKTGGASELFAVANKWLGRLPGGLAMATTGATGLFGAVCGSSTAGVATMTTTCYPEMRRHKYRDSLSTGCIAAGSGIDLMIPPSLGFIIYGIMSEESIGKLFIAGIIPGLLQVLSFFLVIYLMVRMKPELAPLADGQRVPWREKIAALRGLWTVAALFGLVMGGIYFGYFTPIEAGGVASAGAFLVTALSGRLSWAAFKDSLLETTRITVIIFVLLLGAMVFNVFLTLSQLPQTVAGLLNYAGTPAVGIAIILLLYLPLGMIMDSTAMIVLTVPLYLPFLIGNDVNLIWFGVLLIMMVQISLITPPIGMNVFVLSGIVKHVPMLTIFRGIVPFVIANIIIVILLASFPQISLLLPTLMR